MKITMTVCLLSIALTGCALPQPSQSGGFTESQAVEGISKIPSETPPEFQSKNPDEEEEFLHTCLEFYQSGQPDSGPEELSWIQAMAEYLGSKGYTAVDSKNQIDMTKPEQAVEFCKRAETGQEGRLTLIEIIDSRGLVKYDFQTQDSRVEVEKKYFEYQDGGLKLADLGRFSAENWNYYEEDGYFMFSGVYFSEESYALTLSGEEEYKAFRVKPLPERCRELNRNYVMPVGYECNNLFITNWSEEEFGNLNFYDLYDRFCFLTGAPYVPQGSYETGENSSIYRIPAEAFESVIQEYIYIDSQTLREKSRYHAEDNTYEYRPRGFEEAEYLEYPYPEVVNFTENPDGTVSMMVHAVFPYKGLRKACVHEVTVRPLEGGRFQYVSNRIAFPDESWEADWHKPRR